MKRRDAMARLDAAVAALRDGDLVSNGADGRRRTGAYRRAVKSVIRLELLEAGSRAVQAMEDSGDWQVVRAAVLGRRR